MSNDESQSQRVTDDDVDDLSTRVTKPNGGPAGNTPLASVIRAQEHLADLLSVVAQIFQLIHYSTKTTVPEQNLRLAYLIQLYKIHSESIKAECARVPWPVASSSSSSSVSSSSSSSTTPLPAEDLRQHHQQLTNEAEVLNEKIRQLSSRLSEVSFTLSLTKPHAV